MSEKKVKVAIVGASGYSGQELLRLLLMHANVELVCVTSRQSAGQKLTEVFPRFCGGAGDDLSFVEPSIDGIAGSGAECAFLTLPHGVAVEFAAGLVEKGLRVIDLSADFRLEDPEVYKEYYDKAHPSPELMKEAVYGLPEIYREKICGARIVASPGCYPTSKLTRVRVDDLLNIIAQHWPFRSSSDKSPAQRLCFSSSADSSKA